ncbi:MAG TPA: ROK family protein [Bryobacteraceae bacterium]|nr:ROK family protein [Bryobacteraceae bacterium]
MARTIGIIIAEGIVTGLVEGHELAGKLRISEQDTEDEPLLSLPPEGIAQRFAQEIAAVGAGGKVDAVGVALPGIINCGFIEESPNLRQLKGAHMQDLLRAALKEQGIEAPAYVYNDADVLAAGLAATHGNLDRFIRVWTLGNGIGFGVYPRRDGVWEGGHVVVSLDPRERYCGCGGVGHLEGIMGYRAMRLRFLDMEPDEVFENAQKRDQRCVEFVKLWHRALAAATANSIHLAGPGKFFISGFNSRHLDINLLHQYLHEMVKLSPLQSYVFEVVPSSEKEAVIGAAVSAAQNAAQ